MSELGLRSPFLRRSSLSVDYTTANFWIYQLLIYISVYWTSELYVFSLTHFLFMLEGAE